MQEGRSMRGRLLAMAECAGSASPQATRITHKPGGQCANPHTARARTVTVAHTATNKWPQRGSAQPRGSRPAIAPGEHGHAPALPYAPPEALSAAAVAVRGFTHAVPQAPPAPPKAAGARHSH